MKLVGLKKLEWARKKRVDTPPGTIKRKVSIYNGIDEKRWRKSSGVILNNGVK